MSTDDEKPRAITPTVSDGRTDSRQPSHRYWYGELQSWKGPRGTVQVEAPVGRAFRDHAALTLPEPVLRLAQEEYDRRFPGQPYERMQQRGGLGVLEVVALLADIIERERNAR